MAPVKPAQWTGVRDCVQVGHRSPQDADGPISEVFALDRQEPMSEKCLNLNVFTPGTGSGNRPVMVWLHGGGFSSASGNWLLYDGTNLARKEGVVVVSVTHRLNLYGFLYLADLGGEKWANAGNAGMQDIVAALQWVKDNIAAFGGNPTNVTVFGQSGGGGKATTLMAMPSAKGLFHRAIAMSGSAIRGATRETATRAAEQFLTKLGIARGISWIASSRCRSTRSSRRSTVSRGFRALAAVRSSTGDRCCAINGARRRPSPPRPCR